MLSRRVFVGGILFASASGCAAPPWPEPAPPSQSKALSAGELAVATLRDALDAAATQGGTHDSLRTWALSVSDDQIAALSLPSPPEPRATVGTTPTGTPSIATTPAPAATGATHPGSPVTALMQAAKSFAAESADAAASRPLLWASMSAWAVTLAAQWPTATARLEPARTVLDPAPQTAAEAVQSASDAATASLYGLQVAAGTPGLPDKEKSALLDQQNAWLTLRDTLSQATASASPGPTPAPPWYQVVRPKDPASAHALVTRLHHEALPVLGRALAYAPAGLRAPLSAQITASASVLPMWGGLMQRWPGLPQR